MSCKRNITRTCFRTFINISLKLSKYSESPFVLTTFHDTLTSVFLRFNECWSPRPCIVKSPIPPKLTRNLSAVKQLG